MMLYLPGSIGERLTAAQCMADPQCAANAYVIQQHGQRASLIIGSLLNMAGAALRLGSTALAPDSSGYAVLLFGQCLAAFAQPFFTNTVPHTRTHRARQHTHLQQLVE